MSRRNAWRAQPLVFCLVSVLVVCSAESSTETQEAFWQQTNGPIGGNVTALASYGGDLYVGTQSGNVFQYAPAQQRWEPRFLGATRDNVTAISVDSGGRVYFATPNDGVFRSASSSDGWERIVDGLEPGETRSLLALPNGVMLTGTMNGLFRLANRGSRWTKELEVSVPIYTVRTHDGAVYAAGGSGRLFRSTDSGQTWETHTFPVSATVTALGFGTERLVYAGTIDGTVFRSSDGGVSWSQIAEFPRNSVSAIESDASGRTLIGLGGPSFSSEGGGIHVLDATNSTPQLLFDDPGNAVRCLARRQGAWLACTSVGLFRSITNGRTWSAFNHGLIAQRINDIVVSKRDVLFAGTYGGVFRSDDDGRTWIEVNNGLRDLGVVDMAINDQGDVFVGTYLSTVFRSRDSGKTWQLTSKGIPSGTWVMSLVATASHVFAAVSEAGVYRSADNGKSWQPVNAGLDANRNYQALAVGSRNELFVANTRGDVFRSNDLGDSWKRLPAQSPIDDSPAALAVDGAGRLYYGAVVKGLFRYSVQRQDWELLNRGMGNSTVRSVLVIDGAMFVGTSGAVDYAKFRGEDVYQSVDEGMTWSLVNAGLKHPRLKALAVSSKGLIFAGTWGGGVYRSVHPIRR